MEHYRGLARLALAGVLAAFVPTASFGAAAEVSEDVFKGALRYTVQVKATLPVPFDGDRKGSGLGAGFLVDAGRGWIMTNAHVVGRSPSRVEVAFHGEEFTEASKVYVDPFLDVAIIRVSEKADIRGIVPPQLACDSVPSVGHAVGAFGHPWRLQYTGTRGIISGVTARYRTELLQTDAPINGGNSGGPLISLETGRVVGINTAGIRGSQNTNFALGMKYACRVLELMREGKDPSPPALPVVYYNDHDDERVLKIARNYGGDPAIDVRAGDIIRGVEGVAQPVENETQLFHVLRGRLASFGLRVERGGEQLVVAGSAVPQTSFR